MNENIQKLDNIIKMMIGEANELNEKVENTKIENKELHEKLLDFEKDFLKIQRESSKFDNVLEKFSQLDSLIIDIESRNKQLEQKQIQFAKTEDRLGKLIKNAEDLIEQLDLLIEKANVVANIKGDSRKVSSSYDEKTDTIIELFKQGWSVEEIARVTNKSIGEVNLTIQLYGQKK